MLNINAPPVQRTETMPRTKFQERKEYKLKVHKDMNVGHIIKLHHKEIRKINNSLTPKLYPCRDFLLDRTKTIGSYYNGERVYCEVDSILFIPNSSSYNYLPPFEDFGNLCTQPSIDDINFYTFDNDLTILTYNSFSIIFSEINKLNLLYDSCVTDIVCGYWGRHCKILEPDDEIIVIGY